MSDDREATPRMTPTCWSRSRASRCTSRSRAASSSTGTVGPRPRGRRGRPRDPARRDLRPGGGVRAAASPPSARPILRLEPPTAGRWSSTASDVASLKGEELRARAPAHPDGLPGPAVQPRPAPDRRVDARGGPARARPRQRQGGDRTRLRELLSTVGPAACRAGEVPARVLGRPAAAHRHRPGAGGRPRPDRRRRAGQRPRRLDPGPGDQPARGPPGQARAHLPRDRPRPGRRAAHQRPDRRDVPRRPGRGVGRRRALRRAAAPLHAGADVGRAGARPGGRGLPRADPAHRRPALAGQPARRAAASTPAARGARRRCCDTERPAAAGRRVRAPPAPPGGLPLRRADRLAASSARTRSRRSWSRGLHRGRRTGPVTPPDAYIAPDAGRQSADSSVETSAVGTAARAAAGSCRPWSGRTAW